MNGPAKEDRVRIIRSAVGSMPAWGLIDTLRKAGVEIIGIDASPLSFGLYLLEKSYVVPRGDDERYIGAILDIVRRDCPQAILPGPEEEMLALSKNRTAIEAAGAKVLCPDYDSVSICTDKVRIGEAFTRIGVPVPETFDRDNVRFPCVIKPRFGRGSTNVYIARDAGELSLYYPKVPEPVVQAFVNGDEYTVDVLADKDGGALSVVPRLRLGIESGISVKGKTVYDEEIIDHCRRIAKKLRLYGPSCIQCIKDETGPRFLEVNTRFGGGSILSVKADPTIIPNLIRLIKGETPVRGNGFTDDLVMLRYYSEVFVTSDRIRDRRA